MQKRNKAEWEALLSEYNTSDLTQKAWCERKGINLHAFQSALYKKSKPQKPKTKSINTTTNTKGKPISKPAEKTNWLPVTVMAENEPIRIQIKIGTYKVQVSHGFDERMLKRVCSTLAELC